MPTKTALRSLFAICALALVSSACIDEADLEAELELELEAESEPETQPDFEPGSGLELEPQPEADQDSLASSPAAPLDPNALDYGMDDPEPQAYIPGCGGEETYMECYTCCHWEYFQCRVNASMETCQQGMNDCVHWDCYWFHTL